MDLFIPSDHPAPPPESHSKWIQYNLAIAVTIPLLILSVPLGLMFKASTVRDPVGLEAIADAPWILLGLSIAVTSVLAHLICLRRHATVHPGHFFVLGMMLTYIINAGLLLAGLGVLLVAMFLGIC